MKMTYNGFRIWMNAVRPFSLSGSIIPVALGGIAAYINGYFNIILFLLSMMAIAAFQIGANLLNAGDDYVKQVDTKESCGSSDVVVNELLTVKQVNRAGIGAFIFGALIGLFLAYEGGILVLILGLAGALGGYFYTKKPFELKYHGLGVPLIFLLYGPLPVLGSYYLLTGSFSWNVVLLSIPTGLLTTAILHANDIRDMVNDRKAGIKTFALIIGSKKSKKLYIFLLIASFVSIILMAPSHIAPLWSLAVLITLPLALGNIKKLNTSGGQPVLIKTLDKDTAKLQLLFGIVLIASILIPSII